MGRRGNKKSELAIRAQFAKTLRNQHNNTEVFSQKFIWDFLWRAVCVLGMPFEKEDGQSGPKFSYDPKVYVCAFLYKTYFNLTYRELEEHLKVLLGFSPDFRSLSWAARKKLSYRYIERAIKMLAWHVQKHVRRLKKHSDNLMIGDGTGFSHSTKDAYVKFYNPEGARVSVAFGGHTKLYVNIRYEILAREIGRTYKKGTVIGGDTKYYKKREPIWKKMNRGIVWIDSISVGKAYRHDSMLFKDAFNKKRFEGMRVLLDAGFDGDTIFELLELSHCEPHVKLKDKYPRSRLRQNARKIFKKAIYKLRAIVEGIFGATKTRSRKLRNRGENARFCEAAALAFAYQARAYLRIAFATGLNKTRILRVFIFVKFAATPLKLVSIRSVRAIPA